MSWRRDKDGRNHFDTTDRLFEAATAIHRVEFHGHVIPLERKPNAPFFTKEHGSEITEVLKAFWDIDPRLVKSCTGIISTVYDENIHGKYPKNGEVVWLANQTFKIQLTQRGMSLTQAHRVSPTDEVASPEFISAFHATIAHEMTHNAELCSPAWSAFPFPESKFLEQFFSEWQEHFGWKGFEASELTDEWKNVPGGWENSSTGEFYASNSLLICHKPELCIGGVGSYAASHWIEDVCDSFAAFVTKSTLLAEEKRTFIEKKILHYSESRLKQNPETTT